MRMMYQHTVYMSKVALPLWETMAEASTRESAVSADLAAHVVATLHCPALFKGNVLMLPGVASGIADTPRIVHDLLLTESFL